MPPKTNTNPKISLVIRRLRRPLSPGGFNLHIVISKKIVPKAVERNRIKRIIKVAVRSLKKEGDFLVIVKQNISGLKSWQLGKTISSLINHQ